MTGELEQHLRGTFHGGNAANALSVRIEICCTGVNGSHTLECQSPAARERNLTCWCCGGLFDRSWAALWSHRGSRCMECGVGSLHTAAQSPCRLHVGELLAPYRINSHGIPV